MRALLLPILLTLPFLNHGLAVTVPLPDVPPPTLTADKVLAIARKDLGKEADKFTLVAVDWCKASEFQPHYYDGSEYSPAGDLPDQYCWFVTYLYKEDRHSANGPKHAGVVVIRIKDDGTIGRFIGVRT